MTATTDRRAARAVVAVICVVAALTAGCGGPSTAPSPVVGGLSAVLIGAGDIAVCGQPGSELTARVLDLFPLATVFTAGDNAYWSGSAEEFRNCYDPTWGRHKNRTKPSPGNHEYQTAGAAPYFAYFGAAAGLPGFGYYSFQLAGWTIVSLNSQIDVGAMSAQAQWLREELQTNRTACTAAIWHHPLFTSGPNRDQTFVRDIWRILYEFDAEIVINGHDHLYERFAPQDPDGRPDAAHGIREFIVGTGGAPLYYPVGVHANSEIRLSEWGVAKFTLADNGFYQWEFVPAQASATGDRGTGQCH